jgi:hypothetical protein
MPLLSASDLPMNCAIAGTVFQVRTPIYQTFVNVRGGTIGVDRGPFNEAQIQSHSRLVYQNRVRLSFVPFVNYRLIRTDELEVL